MIQAPLFTVLLAGTRECKFAHRFDSFKGIINLGSWAFKWCHYLLDEKKLQLKKFCSASERFLHSLRSGVSWRTHLRNSVSQMFVPLLLAWPPYFSSTTCSINIFFWVTKNPLLAFPGKMWNSFWLYFYLVQWEIWEIFNDRIGSLVLGNLRNSAFNWS